MEAGSSPRDRTTLDAAGALAQALAVAATAIGCIGCAALVPGRLDASLLQLAMMLGASTALTRSPSEGTGFAAGLLAGGALAIGAATMAVLAVLSIATWTMRNDRSASRGLGVGAMAGLAIGHGLAGTAADAPGYALAILLAGLPLAVSLLPSTRLASVPQ